MRGLCVSQVLPEHLHGDDGLSLTDVTSVTSAKSVAVSKPSSPKRPYGDKHRSVSSGVSKMHWHGLSPTVVSLPTVLSCVAVLVAAGFTTVDAVYCSPAVIAQANTSTCTMCKTTCALVLWWGWLSCCFRRCPC